MLYPAVVLWTWSSIGAKLVLLAATTTMADTAWPVLRHLPYGKPLSTLINVKSQTSLPRVRDRFSESKRTN